jgi:hypothetical protein
MEALQASGTGALRGRALVVLGLFAATFAYGLMLLAAFEPDVQRDSAAELVARSDDARAFLVADCVFIVLYAIAVPIAIWRFGAALEDGRPPLWIWLAASLLGACGIVDVTENTLLLSATGAPSPSAVDAAHDLAVPKFVLFGGGLVLTIVASIRALRIVRSGRA